MISTASKEENFSDVETALLTSNERVLMQTATAKVSTLDGNEIDTKIYFDCGSQRSYITDKLCEELKLIPIGYETLTLNTFGTATSKSIQSKVVQILLILRNGDEPMYMQMNVVPQITGGFQRLEINCEALKTRFPKILLADRLHETDTSTSIDFLLGNDYYWDVITSEKIEIRSGLYLISSKLGWIVTGRVDKNALSQEKALLSLKTSAPHDELLFFNGTDEKPTTNVDLNWLWKLDSIGIKDDPYNNDDEKALQIFNDTVQFSENRYYVTWPRKEGAPELPTNYGLALGRLEKLLQRLKENTEVLEKYNTIIEDQLEKGIIEKVKEGQPVGNQVHYLPHHPVISPQRNTTKIRIVYDASAKIRRSSPSLNDCLYRGPVMLNDLCGLLLRFRMNPIGILSDIEKAFLQIGLQTQDRDVTRFFWMKDHKLCKAKENLQIYRFKRVPFGVISSPFLLAASIVYHLKKIGSALAMNTKDNIYVDNVLSGANNVEDAVVLYKELKRIFNEGSMNLREWASNSEDFHKGIPLHDQVRTE